jgi:hypothetical protein
LRGFSTRNCNREGADREQTVYAFSQIGASHA